MTNIALGAHAFGTGEMFDSFARPTVIAKDNPDVCHIRYLIKSVPDFSV
jgi:hypothetical protein